LTTAWYDLADGALGALVIVDSRRVEDCHAAVNYVVRAGLPLVVAVNAFHGHLARDLTEIRWAPAAACQSSRSTRRSEPRSATPQLMLLDEALAHAYRLSDRPVATREATAGQQAPTFPCRPPTRSRST
jgi:hypothetical protein